MSDPVLLEERDQVAIVTLNRPDQLNALNRPTLDRYLEIMDALKPRRDIRAVVVQGAGERAFCAGADLKERAGMDADQTRAFLMRIRRIMDFTERLPMPTLAAIDGFAFGGGCELALSCDIRVVGQSTKIGLTECALGIIPGAGGTQRLPRLVGPSKAKELIFTARRLDAQGALDVGLADHVVEAGGALNKCLKIAEEIKGCAPIAVQTAKAAIDGGLACGISEGLLLEERAYEITLFTEDRLEALAAFKEKRKPAFKGM
jgi:enoyl-CoA hydratase/carnithine racemase